jgi:glycosyltransferase involved in cell wall biosynthesis
MKLSVVIPVYNERDTVEEVLKRVSAVEIPKEIIVVDDGSTDGTGEKLETLKSRYSMEVLRNPVNRGKGASVRLGFLSSTGDVVIIQDADLELDPNEYGRLMEPIRQGRAEVVYGTRFSKGVRSEWNPAFVANKVLTHLTNFLYGTNLTDMETCYKVLKKNVLEALRLEASGFDIEPEITAKIARGGFKICEVPVSYKPRTSKEGKKIKWRDGLRAVWALFKYRVQPARKCLNL